MTNRPAGGLAALALALLLAAAPGSRAAEPATLELEAMTWPELRERIAAGSTTILVPIGGTEQNGAHMVLGKHNVRARVLAGQIARRLGHAIVAPVIAYVPEGSIDPPAAHMRWPGTISIPEPAFEATLEGAARSFRQAGLRDIVLLGDHGGYRRSLERVADKLNREWSKAGSPARVHVPGEYYRVTQTDHVAALKSRGLSTEEIGRHAGAADTSLALAVDPSLVRAELMARKPDPRDGVDGDPRRASIELGRLGTERIVEATVAVLRERLHAR